MSCREDGQHAQECANGWQDGGYHTVRRGGGRLQKIHQVEPCPFCKPGQRKVWEAGLLTHDWTKNPEAKAVYNQAMGILPEEPKPKRHKGVQF